IGGLGHESRVSENPLRALTPISSPPVRLPLGLTLGREYWRGLRPRTTGETVVSSPNWLVLVLLSSRSNSGYRTIKGILLALTRLVSGVGGIVCNVIKHVHATEVLHQKFIVAEVTAVFAN